MHRIYIPYFSYIYIYHNIEFILQGPCPRRKLAAARRAAKEGKADANASVEGGEGGMAGWWFEPAKIVTIWCIQIRYRGECMLM